MHIYAFGSICRGDVSIGSDVDLLAIVKGQDDRLSPDTFSIYSYRRIEEIWSEGNPFAWHLSLEAKMLFAVDGADFLGALGRPNAYVRCASDCQKFHELFLGAQSSLQSGTESAIFDLSTIFLAIRNAATCYALGVLQQPEFSRHAALRLNKSVLCLPAEVYAILERSRILCTRGLGDRIGPSELQSVFPFFPKIDDWMAGLTEEAKSRGV